MDFLKRGCNGSNICHFAKIFQRACFSVLSHRGWLKSGCRAFGSRRLSRGDHGFLRIMAKKRRLLNLGVCGHSVRLCHTPGFMADDYDKHSAGYPAAVAQRLQTLLGDVRKAVHAAGIENLNSLARYYFLEGGKLLRPTIVLLMAGATSSTAHLNKQCTEEISDFQYQVAVISEMIHTASLVHDDVIDEADQRRGRNTVHGVSNNKMAILVGDYILAKATQILASIGSSEVTSLFAQVIEDLVRGEFMQLTNHCESDDERFAQYMSKTFMKTASLFARSCKSVALLAGCSNAVKDAAFQYGRHVGIAFQLIDDMLDFVAESTVLGKPAIADLRLGIATAPVLFAARQRPELIQLIERRFSRPGDVQLAWDLVYESNGVAQTRHLAELHCQEAIRHLDSMVDSECKQLLIATALQQIDRKK